jgi:hypothetical protein
MECVPALSVVLMNVATPLAFSVPVPRTEVPSRNVILPVGIPVPAEGFTVAVKVTAWPKTEGLGDETTTVAVPGWTV